MSNLTQKQRATLADAAGHAITLADPWDANCMLGGLFGRDVTITLADGTRATGRLSRSDLNRIAREEARLYVDTWIVSPLLAVLADAENRPKGKMGLHAHSDYPSYREIGKTDAALDRIYPTEVTA